MTFANVMESQIKFLICLESKAGMQWDSTVFNNACRQEKTELSQNNLSFFTVLNLWWFLVFGEQHGSMFSFPTDRAPFLCLPLFSLTASKKQRKKQQEQVTKKFSEWKQAHVRIEPSKTSKTRWEQHHNIFTHLLPFCQLCTTKNFLHTH